MMPVPTTLSSAAHLRETTSVSASASRVSPSASSRSVPFRLSLTALDRQAHWQSRSLEGYVVAVGLCIAREPEKGLRCLVGFLRLVQRGST